MGDNSTMTQGRATILAGGIYASQVYSIYLKGYKIYGVNTQSSTERWTQAVRYLRPLLAILVPPRMVICIIITLSFVQIPNFIMLASIVFSYLGIQILVDRWVDGCTDGQTDRWTDGGQTYSPFSVNNGRGLTPTSATRRALM